MRFRVGDALWVRLVDVAAALSARSYAGDGEVVVEVADVFCPWNEGRWRVGNGGVDRTDADADLRCDVGVLGSVYLGGSHGRSTLGRSGSTSFARRRRPRGRAVPHGPGAVVP